LSPRGEFSPLGVKFSVHPSILLNSRESVFPGANKEVNISPSGQILPLGARGDVNNGPLSQHIFLTEKLRG
jgi:hypothetical protein